MGFGVDILQRREGELSEDKQPPRSLLFWLPRLVYTRLRRVIKQYTNRVYFTEDEVQYMIDIVDVWIEGHRDLDPDDDEVEHLFENMSVAVDVRDKLWEQLTNER